MAELGTLVQKIRSKNAGPFWLTIDIFCGTAAAFKTVSDGLNNGDVARTLGVEEDALKRFDMGELNVIKLSLPRPQIQGSVEDRDLHGASWSVLLRGIEI